MSEIRLQDSVTIAIRQRGNFKKVAKLSYSKEFADFYIMLPYLTANEYYCGLREKPRDSNSADYNIKEDSQVSNIPVKLTYHESGQVHFKPVNPNQSLNPSIRLAEIKTTPIKQLDGRHVFTVMFEGFHVFKDVKESNKTKNDIVEVNVSDEMEYLKLVGYAGFSRQSILNKYEYGKSPDVTIVLVRKNHPKPLYIGIYARGGDSIRKDGSRPYIMALTGFQVTDDTTKFLFLSAETPLDVNSNQSE